MPPRAQPFDATLTEGRAALAAGDWAAAKAAFADAVEQTGAPEAFEGLAEACWWQHLESATFEARERAYHLYRRSGDAPAAARMAMLLAGDALEFRGEAAVCNGWMRRARRLLRELDESPEYGALLLYEGHFALMMRNDTTVAMANGAQAAERARANGNLELEMLGLAVEGLARVSAGQIDEGMARLDEAAAIAISEETASIVAKGTALCYLMDACDRARDYERARQWCARAEALAVRWRADFLPAICRPHLAVVLIWRGEWAEAEVALTESADQMREIRAPLVGESLIRLGELRVRQGRLDEARTLFAQVEGDGLAHVGMGELALASGDVAGATAFAERRLRHLPRENRMERTPALELLVRANVAQRNLPHAQRALDELAETAAEVGTAPLLGSARYAAGLVALCEDEPATARELLEDAIDYFDRDSAPFDTGRARTDLAGALQALGQDAAAEAELRRAEHSLQALGALGEAARASMLLAVLLDRTAPSAPAGTYALTRRELQVLRMLAASASNQEIAAGLYLSTRTVERHISSIYGKLGLVGRNARTAAAAWAFTHGLAEPATA